MGRPKGSKNKSKAIAEQQEWLDQKESSPLTAVTVAKRKKSVSPIETPSTTTLPEKLDDTSSGTASVKSASTPLVVERVLKESPSTKIVKGYVNILKSRYGYHVGGDIHETIEDAKKISGCGTVATVYLAFEVPK